MNMDVKVLVNSTVDLNGEHGCVTSMVNIVCQHMVNNSGSPD